MELADVSSPHADRPPSGIRGGNGAEVLPRWLAALQAFLVCGIPTQLLIQSSLVGAGVPMGANGSTATAIAGMSLEFFALSSLLDAAIVALLIGLFLRASGESPRALLFGGRPVRGELLRGALLIPLVWLVASGLVYLLSTWFPSLHTVSTNPFLAYMNTSSRAALFILVVILAGGVREELQRGFILLRFDQRLGGGAVGLAVYSVVFGLEHLPQGLDAAMTVGLLGLFWGLLYLRRRSVVMAIVSHAGFDTVEILQQLLLSSM